MWVNIKSQSSIEGRIEKHLFSLNKEREGKDYESVVKELHLFADYLLNRKYVADILGIEMSPTRLIAIAGVLGTLFSVMLSLSNVYENTQYITY